MPNKLYSSTDLSELQIYRIALVRSLSDGDSLFYHDALIITKKVGAHRGRISAVGDASEVAIAHGLDLDTIPKLDGLLMPAFFDTHFHWVQDDVRVMPKASLIEWLEKYTFPEEAKYGSAEFARQKAEYFWKRILSQGTVGGLCYSSIHDIALEEAMRLAPNDFLIGNVLMTMNCPANITQTVEEAIDSVERAAELYKKRYVCTPRFAPTTAPEVMIASAKAARLNNCFQQTHLDENEQEVEWVMDMYKKLPGFEDVASYTEIYSRVGMLGPKSVFGHCIFVTDAEWCLLADSGSRIASCPTSNAPLSQLGLGSGLFDFEKAESYDVLWSLASDIGGGPFLSMFDVMRSFVDQNVAAGRPAANYNKALHRSTFKGAEVMDISEDRGMLSENYYFDAIRVPMPSGVFSDGDGESVIEAVVRSLPDREATGTLVLETFIKGESHFRKDSPV